jgi:murein endopeptidase
VELVGRSRPQVQVRSPTGAASHAFGIDLDEFESFGNDSALTTCTHAAILDRMLKVDQRAWRFAHISLVDEDATSLEQALVALDYEVDHPVQ